MELYEPGIDFPKYHIIETFPFNTGILSKVLLGQFSQK